MSTLSLSNPNPAFRGTGRCPKALRARTSGKYDLQKSALLADFCLRENKFQYIVPDRTSEEANNAQSGG